MTITWANCQVMLAELQPWADNPRLSTKAQARRLLESWQRFGQVQTIAIGPGGQVYDGHQRLSALLTLHGKSYQVDARRADRELTDEERRALVITLHAGAVGSWSWDDLANWDAGALQGWGFDSDTLTTWQRDVSALGNLLGSEEAESADAEPQVDRAAELQEKWQVQPGDVWRIGEHRLACGDCTDRAVVERVMGGEKADCLWTDPPYGVEYVGKTKDALRINNDSREGLVALIHAGICISAACLAQGGSFYIAAPAGPQLFDFCLAIRASGLAWRQSLVWIKNTLVLGHSDYHYMHEVVFYGSKGRRAKFQGGRKQTSVIGNTNREGLRQLADDVWQLQIGNDAYLLRGQGVVIEPVSADVLFADRPSRSEMHPTMKPVELVGRMIGNSTETGAIVFDPFLGSGTTLVACQNLGRRGRGVEISAEYCAVVLQRMSDAFPGIEIERVA